MNFTSDRERLSQENMMDTLQRRLKLTDMVTVFQVTDEESFQERDHFVCSALLPSCHMENVEEVLALSGYLHRNEAGLPSSVSQYEEKTKEKCPKYLRYGNEHGVEPLVLRRHFSGLHKDYIEMSEEFRHFHNLYYDRKNARYIKINHQGNGEVVAIIERNPEQVKIRMKEIRQFLAVKDMHLAVQFIYREFSALTLAKLRLKEDTRNSREELFWWEFSYANLPPILTGKRAFSTLAGVRLISPLPKERSGFPEFSPRQKKKYAKFIIDVGENGDEIEYTCNPNELADHFGKNPDAPNYLTAVTFRREVLGKYYSKSSVYQVAYGRIEYGGLWAIPFDDHHEETVNVWLGDLGRSLPYEEQLYWRSYNVASDQGVSDPFSTHQLLAKRIESRNPEHLFGQKYSKLGRKCEKLLSWYLLLPLNESDLHELQNIHVATTNEQREFDELIQSLTKTLVESLNVKQLRALVGPCDRLAAKSMKSIKLLEFVLKRCDIDGSVKHIGFLRNLQNLRSSGSAHRKGKKYSDICKRLGIDGQDFRADTFKILSQSVEFLDFLIYVVECGRLQSPQVS